MDAEKGFPPMTLEDETSRLLDELGEIARLEHALVDEDAGPLAQIPLAMQSLLNGIGTLGSIAGLQARAIDDLRRLLGVEDD